jgi:hypothetical protein
MLILAFTIIFSTLSINTIFATTSKSELLLRFKPGACERSKEEILTSFGLEVVDEISQIKVLVVSLPEDALLRVKSALSRNPVIDFVNENLKLSPSAIPNDEYYGFQWHLKKVGAPDAWDISSGDPSVVVAVLDSGVDLEHPDLAGKVLPGYNFYDNNCDVRDVSGHGTAVAGVAAAATNNSVGVAAIGWHCSILPVRVTDPNGYTSYSLLAKGLTYAADRGAKVAVVSFGIFGGQDLSSAAKYFMDKGGLVVASGGNTGSYCDDPDNPYIVSVSGTTSDDRSWGTYGPYIDLSAPCSAIYTTINGGGYGNVGGTSFSAPLTAGLIGLIFSANPSLAPNQVEQLLKSTAVDLGDPGYDVYYGWGRINASKALKATVGSTPPDFCLSASPSSLTIQQGSSGSSTLTVTSLNGFNSPVNLTLSGCPTDSACILSSISVTPPSGGSATSKLTVNVVSTTEASTYSLTVTGTSGPSTRSTTVRFTVPVTPPAVPSNLTATAVSSSQIKLAWTDNAANEDGFRIECSTDGTNFSPLITVGTNATGYSDTGLSPFTTYYYRVYAYNAAGNSSYSNTACTTTQRAFPPDFSLSASPSSLSIKKGSSKISTITVTGLNGFSSSVGLTASCKSTGLTCILSSPSLTPSSGSATTTLTITPSSSTPVNTYTLTITGTSGSLTHTITITVKVCGSSR